MEKRKRRRWEKEIGGLSEEELVDWIIKFCNENGITSSTEFHRKYSRLANGYYDKLSKNNKEKIFTLKLRDWCFELGGLSEEKQVEWFIEFCDKNEINSLTELGQKYPRLVNGYYNKLSKNNKEKIFTPKHKNWYSELGGLSEEKQVEWFIEFRDENGIISSKQLLEIYPGLLPYYRKFSKKSKEKIFTPKRRDWYSELGGLSEEKQVEWFIEFRDENQIASLTEFRQKYPRLATGYYDKLSKNNREKIFTSKHKDWYSELEGLSEEKQVGWFIEFRDENQITSLTEFKQKYPTLVKYYYELSKENREKIFTRKLRDWYSELGGLSEEELVDWIIKFCDKNKINSPTELHKKYPRLAKIYYGKLSKDNRKKIFPSIISSLGEETLGKLLTERGYVFTTQKDFPDLRSDKGGILRYDVYIKQKNCLIEFHGSQHFNPNNPYHDEDIDRRDRIKYQYAKDHNIPLFYITDCVEEYEVYGYFAPVLIDWNKLMEEIDSIPDVIVDAEDTAQN